MRFVICTVSAFCPWEPGETEELDAQNRHYRTPTPVSEWLRIAQVSADAVMTKSGPWEFEEWHQFGVNAGLDGDGSDWFDSLYIWPILVSPELWTNGRHRALLIESSGATHFAMVDPDWVPDWVTEPRLAGGGPA